MKKLLIAAILLTSSGCLPMVLAHGINKDADIRRQQNNIEAERVENEHNEHMKELELEDRRLRLLEDAGKE